MFVICSQKALDPVEVAKVCRENPAEEVYALPWVSTPEDLEENRNLNKGMPNRLFPCTKNTKECGGERLDFYERLEDDAYGTMADALKHGTPVLNEIMECPCESAFYGRVIIPVPVPGSVFILRCAKMDAYFPTEPVSAKMYAMTTVPVMLSNTDAFRKATGCEDEMVPVMLATDFVPGSVPFMQFYKLFSGRDFVCSVNPLNFSGSRPITWRYNRAYKVT